MKRGKTRMYKSQLAFVLHLIGLEIGAKFLDQRDRPISCKTIAFLDKYPHSKENCSKSSYKVIAIINHSKNDKQK